MLKTNVFCLRENFWRSNFVVYGIFLFITQLNQYNNVHIHACNCNKHQVNVDMSHNMFGCSEEHDYIGRELASMGLSVNDELIVLNLMVEKPSHIRAFKVLRNDRDCKLAYIRMLLR